MRRAAGDKARVVVKIGSSSLSTPQGGIDPEAISRLASHIDALWDLGHPSVVVTSGAVAAGLPALGLEKRPRDLPGLQVAAAVGQPLLMDLYASEFGSKDRLVGQILITRDVLSGRSSYLHARETLDRMLSLGIVPIVNENDTVVVDELKLGDNDRLAAIVAHLIGAGMMILLSDTPGLYSEDPWYSDEAVLLDAVHHTDEILDALGRQSRSGVLGSGGVATKAAAARMAAWSGIPTVIASASELDVAVRSVRGDPVGTWVEPRSSGLSARKLWIAFGLPSAGSIAIDDGAASALIDEDRSLLAVGVTDVDGDFGDGAAVEVTAQGNLLAKGLVRFPAQEIRDVRGQHSSIAGGVVIHRDDLVVLA